MMKAWIGRAIFALILIFILPSLRVARAEEIQITSSPATLSLLSTLPTPNIAGSLQLSLTQTISDVTLLVSDLQDATGDGRLRDPVAANSFTVSPSAHFDHLNANTLTQVMLQLPSPAQAGIYSGTLLIRWQQPAPGQLPIPLQLHLRSKPALALLDPSNPAELNLGSLFNQRVERQILLRETSNNSDVQNLQLVALDLLDPERQRTIPSSRIRLEVPNHTLAAGALLTITLHINLLGIEPGDYKGALTLAADPDLLLTIPVEVKIHHHWFLPFLVTLAGVLLGLGLSNYMAHGKVRDEYVLRIATLRQAIEEDKQLGESFHTQIKGHLDLAESALRAAQWSDADNEISEATKTLNKWRLQRADWITQLTYLKEQVIQAKVQAKYNDYDPDKAPRYIVRLLYKANQLLQNAASLATPKELADQAFKLEEQFFAFVQLDERLKQLPQLRGHVRSSHAKDDKQREWENKEAKLTQELYALLPDQEADLAALQSAVDAYEQELTQALTAQSKDAAQRDVAETAAIPSAAATPGIFTPTLSEKAAYNPQAAQDRLTQYAWIVYLTGGLVLSLLGLNTLYFNNPIFGANVVNDYLALFVYGLGAETTFASVADLVRRWELPVGSKHFWQS